MYHHRTPCYLYGIVRARRTPGYDHSPYCVQKENKRKRLLLPYLRLNPAKNTHHMEKSLKYKLFGNEFCLKKSGSAYVYPPPWSGASARKISMFENLIRYINGNLGSLYGSTLPKISITWKRA